MKKVKNRWLIAASAVGIHISIGSAYAWSVFTKPLADKFGWDTTEVSLAFSIAIFFLGTPAAFMGKFVEKHGPRKSGMLSALFFGVGVVGSGLATSSLALYFSLLLSYRFGSERTSSVFEQCKLWITLQIQAWQVKFKLNEPIHRHRSV